ncbi:MAG: hypothetical protein PHU42_01240 [Patescibacteria group bacterium]|nr:hypothetical protein [Patescibacteria group bacterium]
MWLRIDEKENIIDSLRMARDCLIESDNNDMNFKWLIISFHHALHNLMLLALAKTDGSGVWRTPIICGSDGLVDINNKKNKLLNFSEAIDYIQDKDKMNSFVNSKPFIAKPYHIETMKDHLNNRLRNAFVHYTPRKGWSISKGYIVEIINPGLEIASFLVFESNECSFDEDQMERIKKYIDEMNNRANELLSKKS